MESDSKNTQDVDVTIEGGADSSLDSLPGNTLCKEASDEEDTPAASTALRADPAPQSPGNQPGPNSVTGSDTKIYMGSDRITSLAPQRDTGGEQTDEIEESDEARRPSDEGSTGVATDGQSNCAQNGRENTEHENNDEQQGCWSTLLKVKKTIIDHKEFSRFDIFICLVSIVLYFVDVGSDIKLAVDYFMAGDVVYGALTVTFIGVAYIVVFVFGVRSFPKNTKSNRWFQCWRICRIALLLLGASPVAVTVEYLYFGLKFRKRTAEDRKRTAARGISTVEHGHAEVRMMDPELRDLFLIMNVKIAGEENALLRLLEGYLEAAPQLCFQLYIVFKEKPQFDTAAGAVRIIAVLSSWLSLAMCAATFYKHMKPFTDLSISSRLLYFLWRACETGGRVLCIALFVSRFKYWLLLPLGGHYVIRSMWFGCATIHRCPESADVLLLIAFVYVTVFGMPHILSEYSRFVYVLYYTIFYLENFTMLTLWAVMTPDKTAWFYVPVIVTVIVFFLLHIVTQIVYYKKLHPWAQTIEWCAPWDWGTVRRSLCDWKFL